MCAICGAVDRAGTPDGEGARRAARAIAHRGPDAEAFFFDGPAGLGHRRLAILDLESGDQPMVRDAVAVVFNGEAYDFASLREELGAKGHPFSSRSDTEVVLRAYLEWGEDFAEHVHGMFALAIWDSRRRKLVLARDRLGKKPIARRSDEHTSELQSPCNLVCRLLLEKKKNNVYFALPAC